MVAMMLPNPRPLLTNLLVGAAVVVGSSVAAATPAGADPNPSGTQPNPFAGLTCNCQQATRTGGPATIAELNRGINAARSHS
jgi:hypothetical protein